ncbi:MAG: hypothetical protein EON99_00390 [Chitinophagaceae bacterium]|nr:MAG: hypothetical protein EON99_00390 [Chitinophagaceae bacterium]
MSADENKELYDPLGNAIIISETLLSSVGEEKVQDEVIGVIKQPAVVIAMTNQTEYYYLSSETWTDTSVVAAVRLDGHLLANRYIKHPAPKLVTELYARGRVLNLRLGNR